MLSIFFTTIILSDTAAVVQFNCYSDCDLCLSDSVQYRCTVTDSSTLQWRIRDESMNSLGTESYTSTSDLVPFTPISNFAAQFSTNLSSTSPSIISYISFTVQSSINGYTIYCEDTEGDEENCTVNVAGPPWPPGIIIVRATQTILHITWTQPTLCIDHYTININYTNNHTLLTTTDTSVNVSLTELYATSYCVSVASVDTANRTGEYSEEKCIELEVPVKPAIHYSVIDLSSSDMQVFVIISWEFNGTIQPLLTAVYLSHNITGSITEEQLPSDDTEFNITTANFNLFFITVFGENTLGNGPSSTVIIELQPSDNISTLNDSIASSISITSSCCKEMINTLTQQMASTYEGTIAKSMNDPVTSTTEGKLSSAVAAGISVAIAVPITAVITAIITVIIMYLCTTGSHKHNNSHHMHHNDSHRMYSQEYDTGYVITSLSSDGAQAAAELKMKRNAAYNQIDSSSTPTDELTADVVYEPVN